MAESGGKESRPDVHAPVVLATLVLAFGVKSVAVTRPSLTSVLCVVAAALGPAPLGLDSLVNSGKHWPVLFGGTWLVALLASIAAAFASRYPITGEAPTTEHQPEQN